MNAFISNVPQYFAQNEIEEFESWLTQLSEPKSLSDSNNAEHYYVMIKEDVLIGCGGFGYESEKNKITLAWGLVTRNFHKQGFGQQLLLHRLAIIRDEYPSATVLIDTTQHSFLFFEKMGFTIQQITPDFYAQGMHRYDMILNTDSANLKNIAYGLG